MANSDSPASSAQRIAITGASGFIGSALWKLLEGRGYAVLPIVRPKGAASAGMGPCVAWDPTREYIDRAPLEGLDAVVHLAGENIAQRRWSAQQKEKILNSRVQSTRLLSEALAGLHRKPRVLLSASAIGYYGDRGDEILTEESLPGTGFLPEVCRAWEAAAEPACRAGIRVVHPRIGVVLSLRGGALPRMALPFRCGLGGKTGNGNQWMSWICLGDLVRAMAKLMQDNSVQGPVNMVSPEPVRNGHFAQLLGRTLHRPTFFTLPAVAVRLALGEMGQALLLASTRVEPGKLQSMHFAFESPGMESALDRIFRRRDRSPE